MEEVVDGRQAPDDLDRAGAAPVPGRDPVQGVQDRRDPPDAPEAPLDFVGFPADQFPFDTVRRPRTGLVGEGLGEDAPDAPEVLQARVVRLQVAVPAPDLPVEPHVVLGKAEVAAVGDRFAAFVHNLPLPIRAMRRWAPPVPCGRRTGTASQPSVSR
ncbi:hypothetical protein ACIGW0_22770 [Streptomyces bikiniensis]|uniref:Uncharacterized protein n=1 Tax=Streptomyces bikiniensis TaxID=1896 RepID=A0ABW8CZE1_STRBI